MEAQGLKGKRMKVWYIDFVNEYIDKADAIQRDHDGFHVVGHGYVANEFVFSKEEDAKKALGELLRKRLQIIQERLAKLESRK